MSNIKIRSFKDKAFFIVICFFSALTAIPLIAIMWELIRKGYKQINISFFTETAPSTLDAMLAVSSNEIIPEIGRASCRERVLRLV